MTSTAKLIEDILIRHVRTGNTARPILAETPLLEGGLELDSIGLLDAIIDIENQCGVTLREEDLTLETLASFGNFVHHIEIRIQKKE